MIVNNYEISNVENLIYNVNNVQEKFINDAISFALNNGYSGYSIDFEPPSGSDFSQNDAYYFVQFLNNFSSALHQHNLKLFVAIDPAYNGVPNSELFYYIYHPYIKINVDYVMVMAYEGYYSSDYPYDFIGAVQSILNAVGGYISINQIQIILSTINPNTNLPFNESQMNERINYVEQSGIHALGIWSMSEPGGFPTGENLWNLISNFESKTSNVSNSYNITFTESGLPSGTTWSVTFNGNATSSTTSTISYTGIANGSYSFSVGSITGYTASPSSGTITVNGGNVNQAITFIENNNQFNPDEIVQVVWSAINVRAGPGLSYEIIGTENYGSQGVIDFGNIVSNNGYLWIPVTYSDGNVGWSASEGLSPVGQATYYYENDNYWPSSNVTVIANFLNVRAGPGTNYSIITSEPFGQTGIIEFGNMVDANGYVWVPILYSDNIIGWSAISFLVPELTVIYSYPTPGYYYTVQSGNTLWNIAYEAYGNGELYYLIMNANGLQNTTIYPGENLYIPI